MNVKTEQEIWTHNKNIKMRNETLMITLSSIKIIVIGTSL